MVTPVVCDPFRRDPRIDHLGHDLLKVGIKVTEGLEAFAVFNWPVREQGQPLVRQLADVPQASDLRPLKVGPSVRAQAKPRRPAATFGHRLDQPDAHQRAGGLRHGAFAHPKRLGDASEALLGRCAHEHIDHDAAVHACHAHRFEHQSEPLDVTMQRDVAWIQWGLLYVHNIVNVQNVKQIRSPCDRVKRPGRGGDVWTLLLSAALAAPCEPIEIEAIAALPTPAILVLGERHAHRRDLRAAGRVLDALVATGAPVTLALEAIHHDEQAALDAFTTSGAKLASLPNAVSWQARWGHAFRPYRPALRPAVSRRVAAGPTLGKAPEAAEIDVPAAYTELLAPMVAEHGMPPEALPAFARSMAWRDLGIAALGVQGWNARGWLVILAGKGHVARAIGTPFQLAALTDAPVHHALLGETPDGCAAGDRVVR